VADVNSNININFNTAAALAQLRSLQAGLSKFHQSLAEGNLAAANAQKGLNAQLLQSVGATGKFSASQVKVAGSTLAFTAALEKNKLSLREYFRYTMAAATANTRVLGRAFAQEREIINRARRDRVKALQAQYIQMNKANAGFMDAIRIMPKSLQMASGKFTELGTRIQYAAQRQQFLNQLLKQGSTQLLNFGKNTQWAGRQLMVGLTMPLALFGGMAAKTFRDLEKEIVKFKRVYGDAFTNDAETDIAVDNIRKLANEYTKYGVAVTKTVEMAATAAAAGFTGGALNAQVETATKLAVLGQIEQQQALETTISLQSAFGISSEELAKKIDFLNAVENQTLLSIEDLTIAIPKAAPVVKQLGGSVEDLAFFLTAMKEGGINASEGANALKSGLASLINPSDKASKMLAGLGINIKGIVEGNQGDIKATVIGFADALDTLDPLNRARAIEQMFGKFQFSRLSTLFQNVTKDGTQASRALSLAGSSVEELAILSEREMKKIEDSVGVKFQAAVEQFKQDIMPLGKVFLEALTPVVKFFGNLFEKFNGLSDQTKKVVAVIVGVVAGLGPVVLMTFGLVMNAIANGIKLFSKLRNGIARLNGQTTVMGAGFNYMTQEQIENAASSQQLHQTHTRLIEVFNVEANSVNALASSYNSLSTQMRAMASQNPALFAGGMGGAKRAVSKLPPVRKFRDGILSVPGPKGAGDIQPAMLAPGEAVIPAKTTEKYKGLISAIFKDQVPGFMAGRVPKVVAKVKGAKSEPLVIPHEERQSGAVFVGMPISAAKAAQSREVLDKISERVKSGRFGSLEPTDFGTKLKVFKGFSFPERGIGGVYRKPNGEIVVVKPTIDADTALSEQRMTSITREIHEGLITPKQTIRTMMDPTDPLGKRKFVVLESPYDPRIAAMDGQFSKGDMVKQLVASTLRGDKDLQRANVSGNIVADVGNAGVYDRASGFRDFAKAMPSMEQQAMINLLGVKGGAKKFFAQQTSGIAASMTPAQYDGAIKAEINQAIPKLERLIKSWDLMPDEQIVYNNMLQRLKDGAKVNWAALQPIHARAGDGIKNLELGDFERFKNVPESRVQIEQLRAGLAAQATREFNLLSEEQQKRVLSAIAKQKLNAGTSGADDLLSQSKMLKFVDDEMVYKDGLFHDKKTLDAGRLDAGKTYDQVLEKVLYQMGVRQKDGAFVSDAKINGVARLRGAMSPVGKQSGSWRSSVPRDSQLYKVLDAEEKAFTEQNKIAGKNDPLKSVRERLAALGYTPKQIDYELRTELSHISKTGEPGRGPSKWLSGSAMFDLRILNNFMNASKRHGRILDWNRKNNFPFIPQGQAGIYSEAVEFMSKGGHPTNAREVMLVRKAAELDLLAHEYQKREQAAGRKPKSFPKLGPAQMSQGVMALIDDRIGTGYYDSTPTTFDLRSGRDRSLSPLEREVLINPDGTETKQTIDPKTNRVIREKRLTRGNTGTPPAGAVPDSGSRKDSRTETLKGNERVVTQRQRRQSRQAPNFRGFRSFRMPGLIDGDPDAKLTPYQRQELKKISAKYPGMNESQLRDILRRKLKHEQDIEKAKAKEAAAARKSAKRAEMLPKQQAEETRRQTADARKRYLEEQRRMELNRQQALNYDAAVKEGQRRELQAIKAKEKEAVRNRRMLRQEKVGRVSGGAAMALGTAGMGLMMAGQQGAGMAVMGASAVAGMAPMLTNPYVAAGVAVTAVAAGLWMLERQSNKTAKAQSQFVDATSATTGKMKAIGEMNSKVGASEIYAEKRSKGAADRYTTGFDRGKQQYGVTFLEGKVGKDIMSGFTKSMASGTDTAAQQMALQLAAYISDGVMSAEQAHSVAAQIGINLNNQTLTSEISGKLLELVGPSGEDLLKNPLEVRIRLVEEQKGVSTVLKNELETSMSDRSFSTDTVLSELSKYLTPGLGFLRGASLIPGMDAGFIEYSAMEMFTETKGEAQASAGAASGVQSLEFSQAQIDSLNAQYDKDKKILETKKEATKDAAKRKEIEDQISALEKRRLDGVSQLRQGNSDILAQQVELFEVAQNRGAVENAFFDSLKEQVRLKAEETGQGDFVNAFLKSSADLESKVLEVKIDTIVGSGMMPVATATTLLSMFAGDEEGLESFIDVTTKLQDPGQVTQLINSLGGIEGTVGKELLLEIGSANPEEANKLMSTIALMQEMAGKEINFQAFFKEEGAIAKLKTLKDELEEVEKLKGPITREVITSLEQNKEAGMPDMSGLLDLWHQWEGLPDEVKKTVIQEYLTILSTISDAQVDTYIAEEAQAAGGGTFGGEVARYYSDPKNRAEVEARAAAKIVMQRQKQLEALKKLGLLGNDSGGGKKDNPLAFLDSLAMGLKQVRDGAFNALKPIESILAAFTNKKTQKDAFNLFDGIQNRLLKFGVGEDLRGAIESMSATDFAKIAALPKDQALFTFAKDKPRSKDTITGLTTKGKAVDQAYKAKDLGDFNFANEETIKNVQDQTKAYNMLISSGLTASQALEVVANKGQAAAIASGAIKKGTPEWDYYIKKIKGANTELERQAVLNKLIRENEEFEIYKDMPKLASQMKDLGYSTEQIDQVLGDPQLAKLLMEDLKDGKLDTAEIAENLNNIEARKLIDIQVQLNKGNLKEGAELGRQIVDEMFAAYEGLIRTGEEANKIIANDKLISGYEADLEPFTKKIQGLTEDVNDLNRQLEMNPLFGDRAIQALEDENSAYSNDLAIISNAAEEVNKRYDEQAEALSKVQEINAEILDQQKRQLDLADAITSGDISAAARAVQEMRAASAAKFATAQSDALQRARENELGSLTARPGGLTQEQITKKQYENSQKIYAMEKDPRRLAILKQIQGKQDDIYNIEENDVERIQAKIDARTQDNIELQRSIDKQLAAITVYGKTRQAWDTVNAGIDYHAAAMLTLNNPDALAGLVTAAGKVDAVWTKINGQMDAYKKNMPDSVKTSLGLIQTGETQSDADKARLAKEREDKEEADRRLAALALAVRKQGAGIALTDAEKELIAASQPKNKRRFNSGAFQILASGGKVKGPGTSTSDSIPAMLSNGEYVINADSVSKYGVQTFDSLNAQRLHTGGPVGHRHGNGPAALTKVAGTGQYVGSSFVPPQYSHESIAPTTPTRIYTASDIFNMYGDKGMTNPSYTPPPADSNFRSSDPYRNPSAAVGMGLSQGFTVPWFDFLGIKGLQQTANKLFQGGKNKALNSFYSATPNNWDYLSASLFPLNFLASGEKAAAQLAVNGGKQTPKMLSLFGKLKGPISKITTPFKELFMPAANPNFNIKNSFLKGLETGKSRMGFVEDVKLVKKVDTITKPLLSKLDEAGFERSMKFSEVWYRKGTGHLPPQKGNNITEGHPLWETVMAISRAEQSLMGQGFQREGKNLGYYASIAGSLVKKTKDKFTELFPALANTTMAGFKLPGQISEKSIKIGKMLEKSPGSDGNQGGINSTFRAILDGVPGFYKTGLDFAEVQREVFGSLFARAANLIAPRNIPVVGSGMSAANGIFSPDIAAEGAQTLRSLARQDPTNSTNTFHRTADPATAASSGYRSVIQSAMRFVDDHDGNITLNPETLKPGLIDFGRILDYSPWADTVESVSYDLVKPLYTYGGQYHDAWKNPEITTAFFSGIDKGIDFLKTLKEKDIVEMLKAAGYKGEELKKKTELILETIKTTTAGATKAANDIANAQVAWVAPRADMPPIPTAAATRPGVAGTTDWAAGLGKKLPGNLVPGASNWVAGSSDWTAGLGKSAPISMGPQALSNPLKPLALGLLGGSTGAAGLLLADPDLSSVKITTQPPQSKRASGGKGNMLALSRGGIVPNYFAAGGYAIGTDTVPAMLTPGEFVMSKYAVDKYGVDNMKSINSGSSVGDSVYNYNLNLNVKSDANPDEIARAVMVQIKSIDAQRIRGARI
jgi:TP901 family phage tail tape measure protein